MRRALQFEFTWPISGLNAYQEKEAGNSFSTAKFDMPDMYQYYIIINTLVLNQNVQAHRVS